MKFVCPSCAANNRCPAAAVGLVIICRKCKTQATVPQPQGGVHLRSWLTSPGWLAVVFVELLAVAGLALTIRALLNHPTVTAPWAKPGPNGEVPRLVLPARTIRFEWPVPFATPGGYYTVGRPRVTLTPEGGEPTVLTAWSDDDPWPKGFAGLAGVPTKQPQKPIGVQLEVPATDGLARRRALLEVRADLRYLEDQGDRGELRVAVAKMRHERLLFIADPATLAAIRKHKADRDLLRRGVLASALVIVCLSTGVYVFAQKRLKIMCPRCNRATVVTYYHLRGPITATPCPHAGETPPSELD